jgi:hypothetical protein
MTRAEITEATPYVSHVDANWVTVQMPDGHTSITWDQLHAAANQDDLSLAKIYSALRRQAMTMEMLEAYVSQDRRPDGTLIAGRYTRRLATGAVHYGADVYWGTERARRNWYATAAQADHADISDTDAVSVDHLR